MSEINDVNDAIKHFPRLRARTLCFGCGAPHSAQTVSDGLRAPFLRSDGPENLVTALWLSRFDEPGGHHETKLADPYELLGATADSEGVSAEEKARREHARESGTGIVGYSVDDDGNRIVFIINGRLSLTDIDWNDETGTLEPHTRELAGEWLDEGPVMYTPMLNLCIAPDGEHVLCITGSYLTLVDIGGELGDRITAIYGVSVEDEDGDSAESTWKIGPAEFVVGGEMDQCDGFWWALSSQHVLFESFDTADESTWHISDPADPEKPDVGRRYPCTLTRNADVYLTVITLAFDENDRYVGITGNADVDWSREAYEYVAAANRCRSHNPLVLVQNRRQTRDQVSEVAVAADGTALGVTRVLEEHANEQWTDLVYGTPAYTPDGRLARSLNDIATDTNRLTMDGRPFTPAGWNVRIVLAATDEDVLTVVQYAPEIAPEVPDAWADAAAIESVFGDHDACNFDVVSIGYNGTITPVTTGPGQWTASRSERGIVVSGRDTRSVRAQVRHVPGEQGAAIASAVAKPGFILNVTFTRLGEHQLYTAIIAPSPESPYARVEKLPVLMKPYGGPGLQQVIISQSLYREGQWWADQGLLVVTADGRGTTGRGPVWDCEIFKDMKDVTPVDQVEAVNALPEAAARLNADMESRATQPVAGDQANAENHSPALRATSRRREAIPMSGLDKVCMIGWSYGGLPSTLAVLDAPNVLKVACVGTPSTDWMLYDTHCIERYLGFDPDVYYRNDTVQDAPKLERLPALIHGFVDDNVTITHSLCLSQVLMATGRPHTFLPLTGVTYMTDDETVTENPLTLQRDFLRDVLA